jgi:hypothetical protein
MIYGALAGAVLGAVIWHAADPDAWELVPEVYGGALGMIPGALLDATIGALIKTDRWEEVPLERLRVSVAPQRDGRFAFGVRIAF